MRLAAYPVEESDLRFDFSAAISCDKHDATNTVFPGVDFIVWETGRQIWLEMKNWEGSSIPARRRGGQRRAFLAKLGSKTFFTDVLRAKFIGTCAYLALTDQPVREDVLFIALLESPRMDNALMLHATPRLRSLLRRDSVWHFTDPNGVRVPIEINAAVLNVAEWNSRFSGYPVTVI